MARNCTVVSATPEEVFAVLADPSYYPRWVVGAKEIRGVEGRWPEPGSTFHHSIGLGPLTLADSTESVEVEPPLRLVLEARGRPLGRARVELTLRPVDGGTEVTMDERASSPPLARLLNPVLDPFVHARNTESLRRLRNLVTPGMESMAPGTRTEEPPGDGCSLAAES